MFFRLSFVTLILAAMSAFGTSIKRDAAQVEQDIKNLDVLTNAFDTSINKFPKSGGTSQQALVVQEATMKVQNATQSATKDVSSSSAFTEPEADTIIDQTQTLVTDIERTLKDIVAKKPAFADLNMGGVVKYDLQQLQNASKEFGTVVVNKMPESKKSVTQEQTDTLNDAFETAVQAYSS